MQNVPDELVAFFKEHPKAALGLSGGVDSAYLLYAGIQCGADMRAYFVRSVFQPEFEQEDAQRIAEDCGVSLAVLSNVDVLTNKMVAQNSTERCYHCKQMIFGSIAAQANADGYHVLLDGTNASDDFDDRPGMRALTELSVYSPLRICGITKQMVRGFARSAGLMVADKPAYACLATRIPTGMAITLALLNRVETAETQLFHMGYTDFRVRVRGNDALLQFSAEQLQRAIKGRLTLERALSQSFTAIEIDHKPRKGN
ncbi:MAG: ATP-dependent sacrificial sulfur transferase LarE [Clostridia bacterium]